MSIMAAATLTATSVGITARVLSDLGRLRDPEGQIILGAAVIDDILGLMILTVVAGLTEGQGGLAGWGSSRRPASALGFLVATLAGRQTGRAGAVSLGGPDRAPGTATAMALIAAFGLAWLAERCGSAMIIGAFAAGLAGRRGSASRTRSSAESPRSAISSCRSSSSRSGRRSI